jgi:hypothetical protein
VSVRHEDGHVDSSLGAIVIVNAEGWFVSAAHVLSNVLQPPRTITNVSPWFGDDRFRLSEATAYGELDLAIGRLEGFDAATVPAFPRFKDPETTLEPGVSLCKLGFPFHEIRSSFDERAETFSFLPGSLPIPFFPIEGIYTRNVNFGPAKEAPHDALFLETSSPGLRGQSGGPVLDVDGVVWAIQSRTTHYPLGFTPSVTEGDRTITEHQFLHVGLGVHTSTIVACLRDRGVSFSLSDG